jgi:hypothetical protein
MHEQMASIENRADQLASTAAGLRALVARFKLEDSRTASTDTFAPEPADRPTRRRRPAGSDARARLVS